VTDEKLKAKVLIVDDEPSARATLEALLHVEEYQLEFAENADEAIVFLEKEPLDLLLLDMMMPGMDGLELCQIIKRNKKWRHIPIILVTALDGKEDLQRGIQAGADDFLSKPVSGIELRARVKSMLRIKAQYDQLQNMLKLREEMANMVVHDMRSPLCSIIGYSDFLRKSLTTERELGDIEKIRNEAKRINLYLSDLLLTAKMESDKLIINRTEINIKDLTDNVLESHSVQANVRNIRLKADVPDNLPNLYADNNLVIKIMDNLVSNAIKYTDADSEIYFRARCVKWNDIKQRPGVRFQIEDQGEGIPDEFQDTIFDKYEVIETHNQGVRQIGLGLAFCKLAVEAHGGKIWIESNKPKGSIFHYQVKHCCFDIGAVSRMCIFKIQAGDRISELRGV